MIQLVAIEGEEAIPDDGSSFMRELCRRWLNREKAYINWGSMLRRAEAAREVAEGSEAVFLAGYGHGGAAAIVAARRLAEAGRGVEGLILLDAVSKGSGLENPEIPDNVAVTVHGRRQFGTLSRPLWGNCGVRAPGVYRENTFWVTHSGASGRRYLSGPPLTDGGSLVIEDGMTTLVTRDQDYDGAKLLWGTMMMDVVSLYTEVGERRRKSAPPPPRAERTHKVEAGESLSIISRKVYRDVLLWPILYDANVGIIGRNPNRIEPGQKLTVPPITGMSRRELDAVRQRGRVA